jgi:hypothetical protein
MKRLAAIVGAIALTTPAAIASDTPQQNGRFALLGGTPHIASKLWSTQGEGSSYTLYVQQFEKNAPIERYEIDVQHYMRVVVVRDDFVTFAYEHPSFNGGTGTFQTAFAKEPHHRFYVYADSMPKGIGRQVFRFVMASDGLEAGVRLPKAATGPNAEAGPYAVMLGKTTLPANAPLTIPLSISSGAELTHVVVIDVNRLTYVPVHSPQHGKLELPPLPASTYATWVQVAGGKAHTTYTARFNLVVQ